METTIKLVVMNCSWCGVPFAMPDVLQLAKMQYHDAFFCPNGHPNQFLTEPAVHLEQRRRLLQALHRAEQAEAKAEEK